MANGSKRFDITGLEGSNHFCKGLGIITSVIGYYTNSAMHKLAHI